MPYHAPFLLALQFSDAPVLQLRAIHCLCASAVHPRCIDAIGTAAVTYISFLFTKLEGLVKVKFRAQIQIHPLLLLLLQFAHNSLDSASCVASQVGVDMVTGGLALAALCLVSCICRVPTCSDSLAKAADPHALSG